jgi:hypothetical protein
MVAVARAAATGAACPKVTTIFGAIANQVFDERSQTSRIVLGERHVDDDIFVVEPSASAHFGDEGIELRRDVIRTAGVEDAQTALRGLLRFLRASEQRTAQQRQRQ